MATSEDDNNFPTLRSSWSRFLADGWRSDMKIICDGAVHNVHSAIICAQSIFFANALKKEHNFREAQTNTVTLDHDEPATVDAAVKFMYLQAYCDTTYGKGPEARVSFQISIYAFADKYGISGLREHCTSKIKELLDVDEFSPELFLYAARLVVADIPGNDNLIRSTLASIASKNFHTLSDNPQFWNIAKAAGGFGGVVLEKLATSGTWVPKFTCHHCDEDITMAWMKKSRGLKTHCPNCGNSSKNKQWESSLKKDV